MGFLLNCSGRDNTLITLSKGFGCTVHELEMVLLDIDLEKIFTAAPHIPKTANQLLFEYTINNLTEPDDVISAFWFHGTRTVADNHFPDGILHLTDHSQLLSECWRMQRPVAKFGRGSVTGKKAEYLTECPWSVTETLYTGDLMHPLSGKLS